ncbi:MAG: hypothetical protein ABW220_01310, partial [Burkholderiaceae bacterium]
MQLIARSRFWSRVTMLTLAAGSTLAAAAGPTLAPIDRPGAAARAIRVPEGSAANVLNTLDNMTRDARFLMLRTFNWLNAYTTPTAVAATRRGIAVPCPLGGNVLALLPKSGKQVLRLSWSNCRYFNGSQEWTLNGSGEAQLPSATFAPDYLLSLHLGTLGEDLVETTTYTEVAVNTTENMTNLHIDGRLPLTRFLGVGIFTGAFDVTIDGKVDSHNTSTGSPEEGYPAYDSVYYRHADDLRLVGSTTHSEANTVLDERVTLRYGTFRQIGKGTNDPLPESSWPSITGQDFQVRRVLRVADATSTVWLDGLVKETRGPYTTCGDLWYSAKTLVPVRQYNVFRYDGKDSGLVIVNGAKISWALSDAPAAPEWYT